MYRQCKTLIDLSAVLLGRVKSAAGKDFKPLLVQIHTLNVCYLQASNKNKCYNIRIIFRWNFYSAHGVGFSAVSTQAVCGNGICSVVFGALLVKRAC